MPDVNREKIGARVDEDLWERFRQFVQDHHGRTRGVLSRELENAIREYIQDENTQDRLVRIEDDVATIRAMLADVDADGGTPVPDLSDADSRTHAGPGDTTSATDAQAGIEVTKPPANASRAQKVDWLVDRIERTYETQEISPGDLRDVIRDEYGFQDRTVDDYYDLLVDELNAERHPTHGKTLVWGDGLDRAEEQAREQARAEAKRTSQSLDRAERE